MAEASSGRGAWPVVAVRRAAGRLEKRASSYYYRHLLGRGGPFASLMGRLVVGRAKRRGRTDVPRSREVWEAEYGAGTWDFLMGPGQTARHAVLAAYIQEARPGARVLDVGCGAGKFFRLLRPFGYGRFVGVDLSGTALEPLYPLQDEVTGFVCADAERYVPEGVFDAIVFNESLYYFQDPMGLVERYRAALAPDGLILVSTFEGSTRALAILRALEDRYPLLDEIRLSQRRAAWTCSVFGPAPRGAGTA